MLAQANSLTVIGELVLEALAGLLLTNSVYGNSRLWKRGTNRLAFKLRFECRHAQKDRRIVALSGKTLVQNNRCKTTDEGRCRTSSSGATGVYYN